MISLKSYKEKIYFGEYRANILSTIQKELSKYWAGDSEYIEVVNLEFKT